MEITLLIMEKSWDCVFEFLWKPCTLKPHISDGFQAVYASVAPGEYMRGNITQMIAFPSWLGKNSTTNKSERILQELRTHMRLQ